MADKVLRVGELIEAIAALHLTGYVKSDFSERGGLMLVAPAAALKTSMLEILDRHYHDVMLLSDINQKTLTAIRDQIAGGKIRTLIFPELAKLYERKSESAAGLEGALRAMVAEGFRAASFEDSRIARFTARAMVMGALVPALARQRAEHWEDSGFARRFLWCFLQLENPDALTQAIVNWQRLPLAVGLLPHPPLAAGIPNLTTGPERRELQGWVKYQPGGDHAIQHQLLVKTLAVLRWWRNQQGVADDSMDVLLHFSRSLGRDGALLSLDLPTPLSPQRRAAERRQRDRAERSAAARRLAQRKKP